MKCRFLLPITALLVLFAFCPPRQLTAAPPPDEVRVDAEKLNEIDAAIEQALNADEMAGCVVAIGFRGEWLLRKAFGERQVLPEREPMTCDTVFDLASLTKPIATATSVMLLVEREEVSLRDPIAKHLPEFGRNGKDAVTVFHMLTHQSGLLADNALADYENGPEDAWQKICELPLLAEPESRFIYSDVGFIVLGELIHRVTGQDLHAFSRQHVFEPLGMHDTGFLPSERLRQRAAATEQRGERWMKGVVHDPRAHRLGGVAGHAGLFSTADDLAVFAQVMLDDGRHNGTRVLAADTVTQMTASRTLPRGTRALGWDKQSPYSSNRGQGMSDSAFGHGGFTGTAIWIDPELRLFVIFLSNRLHPDGEGQVNRLAGRIGSLAVEMIRPPAPANLP